MTRTLATRLRAVLTLLLLGASWLLPGSVRAAEVGEPRLELSPAAATAAVGGEAGVTVTAVAWPDLYGYTLVLTWDSGQLAHVSHTLGDALGADALLVQEVAGDGRLELSVVRRGDPAGGAVSGALAVVRFQALAAGEAGIELQAKLVNSAGHSLEGTTTAAATLAVATPAVAGGAANGDVAEDTDGTAGGAADGTDDGATDGMADGMAAGATDSTANGAPDGATDSRANGAAEPAARTEDANGAVAGGQGAEVSEAGSSDGPDRETATGQKTATGQETATAQESAGTRATATLPVARPEFAAQAAARGAEVLLSPVQPVAPDPNGPIILPLPAGHREGVAVRVGSDGSLSPLPTRLVPHSGGWAVEVWGDARELAVVTRQKTFTDLAGHLGAAQVEALANRLIIEGLTATEFGPNAPLTRAQFSALLVRALGLAPYPAGAAGFTDVPAESWYAGAVGAAVRAGLIRGYEDKTFRADKPLSRTEMVVLLDRALSRLPGFQRPQSGAAAGAGVAVAAFADRAAIPDWAATAIDRAVAAGLLGDPPPPQFRPEDVASRMEAAQGIYLLLAAGGFVPAEP